LITDHQSKPESQTTSINVHFLGATQIDLGIRNTTAHLKHISNLKDLLVNLATNLGSKFHKYVFDPNSNELNDNITILVNGRHFTTLDGLETPLKTGDEVSFFPPIGGG
jgi:MoaD family protein